MNGSIPKLALVMVSTLLAGASLEAAQLYLSPDGSDTNPGTREAPLQSLAEAQKRIRESERVGLEPITVTLQSGTYYLEDTLVLTAADSGTQNAPVRYRAEKAGEVVISGGLTLDLDWKLYRAGIMQAKVPAGLEMDQLFVNGRRQHMARYPNYDPKIAIYNGFSKDAFSPERAARWSDPAGGYIHAMHKHHWGGLHYRITGKNADHTVTYEGGWQNNRPHGMHEKSRFVENIFEELDALGEWFHNARSQTLYFHPPKGLDLDSATFETVRLSGLIEFRGTRDAPVRFISLEGLTFRHAARTFMDTKEPLLRSDWTIYRGGAVLVSGGEDVAIEDCEFDQVGGNAVFVSAYNRRIAIRGAHIHQAGASGVAFVGSPDAVRNPLLQYKERLRYAEIDKTPGPKSDNYPADCLVEDCLVHNIGTVEKQSAGVQISMASRITVRHCSIYETSRAGINISEGTFGGHLIEHCDVFDTVLETGDHGSFNAWGRDRFWQLQGAPKEELARLALLDAEKTIIRNSRWRCDRGWDIDLDDGSSNYELYNNLMLNRGLKLREGFRRVVTNNIAVNATMYPHVWYENSEDVVTGNIWMAAYWPAGGKHWGKEVDRNLFTTEADSIAFINYGVDLNSVWGDPMFIDPANGDFRVQPESPAFNIGFKNFRMDQFGVQRPSLKALARIPRFPEPNMGGSAVLEPRNTPSTIKWMGATIAAIQGEEYSAFGVGKQDGGIHLMVVPEGSGASAAGFRSGDLIQKINGKPTKHMWQFVKVSKGDRLRVSYVREQQERILELP